MTVHLHLCQREWCHRARKPRLRKHDRPLERALHIVEPKTVNALPVSLVCTFELMPTPHLLPQTKCRCLICYYNILYYIISAAWLPLTSRVQRIPFYIILYHIGNLSPFCPYSVAYPPLGGLSILCFCSVLYYTILDYIIIYHIILYCIILYYIILRPRLYK